MKNPMPKTTPRSTATLAQAATAAGSAATGPTTAPASPTAALSTLITVAPNGAYKQTPITPPCP